MRDEFGFGEIATFQCNGDKIIRGNVIRQCLPNGQWSGMNPECQSKRIL